MTSEKIIILLVYISEFSVSNCLKWILCFSIKIFLLSLVFFYWNPILIRIFHKVSCVKLNWTPTVFYFYSDRIFLKTWTIFNTSATWFLISNMHIYKFLLLILLNTSIMVYLPWPLTAIPLPWRFLQLQLLAMKISVETLKKYRSVEQT